MWGLSTVRSEEVSSPKALGHHFSIFLFWVPCELDKTPIERTRLEVTQHHLKQLQGHCLAPRAPCPPLQTGLNLIPGLNKPRNLRNHSQAFDGAIWLVSVLKGSSGDSQRAPLTLNKPHRHPEVALNPSLSEMVDLGLIYGTYGKWLAGTTHWSWPSGPQAAAPCTFPLGLCLGTDHTQLLPSVCSAIDQRVMSPSL